VINEINRLTALVNTCSFISAEYAVIL